MKTVVKTVRHPMIVGLVIAAPVITDSVIAAPVIAAPVIADPVIADPVIDGAEVREPAGPADGGDTHVSPITPGVTAPRAGCPRRTGAATPGARARWRQKAPKRSAASRIRKVSSATRSRRPPAPRDGHDM